MPQVVSTILYILLFILCLSSLIMVHEAGHLAMAKAFKVYCFEYSIGFGPKLFSRKRKNGETYFSLRAIPLGGYVMMYGEAESIPENFEGNIPEERSLMKINKWKRAAVLVAGVFMNFILAIFIFFIAETCCTQYSYFAGKTQIKDNSVAYNAGLRNDDLIYLNEYSDYYFVIDENASLDGTKVAACLSRQLSSSDDLSWNNHFFVCKYKDDKLVIEKDYVISVEDITGKHVSFNVTPAKYEGEGDDKKLVIDTDKVPYSLTIEAQRSATNFFYEEIGINITKNSYHNDFSAAVGKTFKDTGNSATAIFRGLASIFTGGINDVGGIIAVGVVSSNTLQNFGIYDFLVFWGMISVNLAIVNLLPFPGLDGWQLLVTFVEGVLHKEIPQKVKGIVSFVGIAILFAFMIALIVKDLFMFVF